MDIGIEDVVTSIVRLLFDAIINVIITQTSPAMLVRRMLTRTWRYRDFGDSFWAKLLWGALGMLSWALLIYLIVMLAN